MLDPSAWRLAMLKNWPRPSRRLRKRTFALLEQYLGRQGWARSVEQDAAVDLDGPIPWYTYPAISELTRITPPGAKVFEYGSGNSSLWWRLHAAQVVSVEHDPVWHAHSNAGATGDVRLREAGDPAHERYFDELRRLCAEISAPPETLDEGTIVRRGLATEPFLSYVAELMTFPQGHFDIIVVDGMARSACARLASQRLAPGGFIVFDNADRHEYADAYAHLIEQGFGRIDYWGPGPINPYAWCTSVFIRTLGALKRAVPDPSHASASGPA